MSQAVITVENLGKKYRIRHQQQRHASGYVTLRDVLADATKDVGRRLWSALRHTGRRGPAARGPSQEDFWALKDVSFEVAKGESVGIIGRNGSGKSTLLKLLSRVTEPAAGRIRIRGRVASLLEVGTGFHPELTGRENIFLNGSILGMSRAEIRRKFDEIVAFAEVERFLDTPVKRYSSGMYVRLAFAIAAHLEPEILIVDEVLAVGDAQFQKKCLGKMGEVSEGGRTVLFVSHQLNQIRRLCQKCAWLHGGGLREYGPTAQTVGAYEESVNATGSAQSDPRALDRHSTSFLSWEISSGAAGNRNCLQTTGAFTIRFRLHASRKVISGIHGIALYNQQGLVLWGRAACGLDLEPGLYNFTYNLPTLPLRPGVYSWRVSLRDESGLLHDYECAPSMIVDTVPLTDSRDEWGGIFNVPSEFSVEPAQPGVEVLRTQAG